MKISFHWHEKLFIFSVGLTDEQRLYIRPQNVERLAISNSSLEEVMDKFVKGEITFADFDFLNEHREKTLALCEVSDELQRRTRTVKEAFEAHIKEREAFMDFHTSLHDFWGFCKAAVGTG